MIRLMARYPDGIFLHSRFVTRHITPPGRESPENVPQARYFLFDSKIQQATMEGAAMTTAIKHEFRDLPKTYEKLVDILPPRPIHAQDQYDETVEMIDAMAGFELNKDQEN